MPQKELLMQKSSNINIHYLPELVKKYIEYSPYRKYVNLVYEDFLLGTGGTLLKNKCYGPY